MAEYTIETAIAQAKERMLEQSGIISEKIVGMCDISEESRIFTENESLVKWLEELQEYREIMKDISAYKEKIRENAVKEFIDVFTENDDYIVISSEEYGEYRPMMYNLQEILNKMKGTWDKV